MLKSILLFFYLSIQKYFCWPLHVFTLVSIVLKSLAFRIIGQTFSKKYPYLHWQLVASPNSLLAHFYWILLLLYCSPIICIFYILHFAPSVIHLCFHFMPDAFVYFWCCISLLLCALIDWSMLNVMLLNAMLFKCHVCCRFNFSKNL